MGVLGGLPFPLTACAALWCLLGTACGQTADSGAAGGTGATASRSGEQHESTGGVASPTSVGGGSIASGGSSGIVVSSAGFESTGGVVEPASGGQGADSSVGPHVERTCNLPAASPWGGGFLLCGDGSYRRPRAESCNTEVPRAEPGATCHPGDECCLDADCADAPFGYCSYGTCLYGCVSDGDCASDSFCSCQDPIGRCTPTMCHSDAECPPDLPCTGLGALRGFACQSPTSACVSNFDCASGSCSNGQCIPLPG